jgi:hypothetical protein
MLFSTYVNSPHTVPVCDPLLSERIVPDKNAPVAVVVVFNRTNPVTVNPQLGSPRGDTNTAVPVAWKIVVPAVGGLATTVPATVHTLPAIGRTVVNPTSACARIGAPHPAMNATADISFRIVPPEKKNATDLPLHVQSVA